MKAAVAISYFHRKIGPMVFYAYPEEVLELDEKTRLADVMDQSYEEGFFTHKFTDLASLNYYFEIESKFARGGKEMLMISFILDTQPSPHVEEQLNESFNSFASRLKNNKDIYKAFYNLDELKENLEDPQDIKKNSENLRFWIKELYWTGIEDIRERTEEEKWAAIMAKTEIFKVIKKLSKGPLALDDLNKWFSTVFPNNSIGDILTELENEKFIFINTIGLDTYVLLVKDVSIMRVPPNCVIDLEEDSPDLADLTQIYIIEVRDFFEYYKPTPLDSLELFKLFANPKIYNVISQLREGPLPREKIMSMVSESSAQSLLKNLDRLEENSIIQAFSYSGVLLYMLKTDVVLTASFPEYLRGLLPKESKGYVARSYSHTPMKTPDEGIVPDIYYEKYSSSQESLKDNSISFPITNSDIESIINDEPQNYNDYEDESERSKQKIVDLQKELLRKLIEDSE